MEDDGGKIHVHIWGFNNLLLRKKFVWSFIHSFVCLFVDFFLVLVQARTGWLGLTLREFQGRR